MSESFDPYLKWLGIRDPERPPNHYRLLGLDLFESDPEVINGAADRQMSHVRTFQTGPNAAVSQALLNELAVARRRLLNEQSRADYDHGLRTGSLNITTKRSAVSVVTAKIIDGSSGSSLSYRTKKSRRFWFDLAGWVGGGVAAVIVAYFLINSSWFKTELADNPNGGDTRLPQPSDRDPVEPGPTTPQPGLSDPPNTANLPDGPAEQPPEKGGDGGDPELPADNSNSSPPAVGTNKKPDPAESPVKKPANTEAPMEPAVVGEAVAPWDEADRWPELPGFISKPGNEADRRFQPIYIGLANRKYDLVKQFYPQVEEFAGQLSQPVDVESVVAQMEEFWQLVRRSAVEVQAGDALSFRNRHVTVSGVSDRSIELKWLPASDDDGRSAVERFSTKQEDMDRDLAIALATRDSSSSNALVDNFRQYDYLHAKIPVPPELVVGTGVQLSEMTGLLGSDPSAKAPVPDKESLGEARKAIGELYADDLAAKDFRRRQKLAGKLISDAYSTRDDAFRYVLLDEASQLGAEIGDGEVVLTALSEINNDYEIEFWGLLVDRLGAAQKNAASGIQYGAITRGLFEAVNLAVQQEQYEIAEQLSIGGFKAAKKLGAENQAGQFDDYRRQLSEMEEWNKLGLEALEKLESEPDNTKAHLAAARYLCYVKGDWEAGAKHLAKSGMSKLERLAKKDQEVSDGQVEEMMSLADEWYDVGKNNEGTAARALLSRAHYWYAIVKDKASGLDREKAGKRIIELQPLLEFFDPYMDDEVSVQATTWRFGTKDRVVFPTASFSGSVFQYKRPGRSNPTQSVNITKTGDTYQVEPGNSNSRVYMRLMRNGQIELLVYSLEDGRLIVAGWGEPIDR